MTVAVKRSAGLRAAKNIVLLVVLRVVMPLLSIALIMAISRLLGVKGLGQFTLAYGYLGVLNSIGPMGLNAVVTRDGARDRSTLHVTLENALALCVTNAIVLTVVMCGLATFLDYDAGTKSAMLVLSLAIIPCTVGVLLDAAAMAIERVDQIAKGIALEYVIKLGLGVALLLLGYGLEVVLMMAVIGKIAACILQIRLLKQSQVRVRMGVDRGLMRRLLQLAPTFLGISVFATLYWRIDILMLSRLRPVEDVGYYGAAYRILELAMIFPQSVTMALYPQIAAAAHRNLAELQQLGKTALRYLSAFTLPTVVCAIILAKPGLSLLYGPGFTEATGTLAVLIMVLIPYAVVRYHAYVLVAANRQSVDLALNVLMLAVNVVLNLLLIPRYSHLGAAIATSIAIVVYAILQWYYLHRKLPGYAGAIRLPSSLLIATGLAATSAWLLRNTPLPLSIGCSSLVYVVSLVAGGFFSKEELVLMRMDRMLSRFKLFRP